MHTSHPRIARLLGIACATLTVSGTAVAAITTAGARPTPETSSSAPVALPGLGAHEYDVTLPTGDQVRLTSAGGNRYSVAPQPSTPNRAPMLVTAHGTPTTTTDITAIPMSAQALVTTGVLDRSLFDVATLASSGDGTPGGVLPITMQFGGAQSAAVLSEKAGRLPAAIRAVHPATGTVDLAVRAGAAAHFWFALTGQTATKAPNGAYYLGRAQPALASGSVHAWLTDHRQDVAQPDGAPTFTVTEVIHRRGPTFGCNGTPVTLCLEAQLITAVTGSAAGRAFFASTVSCVDERCSTYHVVYQVPAGIYSTSSLGFFFAQQRFQFVWLVAPQVTVAGDTTFTVDADQAARISIATPRPAEVVDGQANDYRSLPDGTWYTDLAFAPYGWANFWATPTPQVTIGTYHFDSGWVLGKPTLDLRVAGSGLNLDGFYPTATPYFSTSTGGLYRLPRFPRTHATLDVVDAGYGRPADFARIDARGKLALIRIAPAGPWGESGGSCAGVGDSGTIMSWQLSNAINAGAAGVLVDSSDPAMFPHGWCVLPLNAQLVDAGGKQLKIPVVELPVAEADALLQVMAVGPTAVDLTTYRGDSPYLYTPWLYREGKIPASLTTTLETGQLSAVTEHYHANKPIVTIEFWSAWRPNEYLTGGSQYDWFASPAKIVDYRPTDPAALISQQVEMLSPVTGPQADSVYGVVDSATPSSVTWGDQPVVPAPWSPADNVFEDLPGKFGPHGQFGAFTCTFCRQGDVFYPITYLVSGSDPLTVNSQVTYRPDSIHLYRDGQELPPDTSQGFVTYTMPEARSWYRLAAVTNNVSSSWTFTSRRPTKNTAPKGTVCYGFFQGSTDPCAPNPLIFLRYNAHLRMTNTVLPSAEATVDVVAYHLGSNAPEVTKLTLSVSFDGGHSWQPVPMSATGDGGYTGTYGVPALANTDGYVTFRTQAHDAGGDVVNQTITHAFAISGG